MPDDAAAPLHADAHAVNDRVLHASSGGTRSPKGPAWERLEDQLRWYDTKSAHHKRWFQSLKVLQIVVAAVIPVVAAAGVSAAVAGALGGVIVVLEGVQQLFQFQQNWVAYRSTAEALKHEKYLFLVLAGPYADLSRPEARLAERVEGLVSQEHAAWTSAQWEAGQDLGTADPAR